LSKVSLSQVQVQQSVQEKKIISAIAKIFEEVSNSNEKLANRVFWLELIIAIATVAGVFITFID